MQNKLELFILMSVVLLQGCATSEGRQNDKTRVYFKTNAPQAIVNCSGEVTEIPGSLKLKRSSNHDCLVQAPGYENLEFRIGSKISREGFCYSSRINWKAWSQWTLGLGNLLAWPVDFFSGAMKTFEGDHFDLRMLSAS